MTLWNLMEFEIIAVILWWRQLGHVFYQPRLWWNKSQHCWNCLHVGSLSSQTVGLISSCSRLLISCDIRWEIMAATAFSILKLEENTSMYYRQNIDCSCYLGCKNNVVGNKLLQKIILLWEKKNQTSLGTQIPFCYLEDSLVLGLLSKFLSAWGRGKTFSFK